MKSTTLIIFFLPFFYFPTLSQVRLIESQENSCDLSKDAYLLKTRISNIIQKGDTSSIEVAFSDACLQKFIGFIDFKDDTLNLCYKKSPNEPEVFCNCCYSIVYKIVGFKKTKHTIRFNDKAIPITDQEYIEIINTREILEDSTFQYSRIVDGKIESIILMKKDKRIIRFFSPDGTLKRELIKEK